MKRLKMKQARVATLMVGAAFFLLAGCGSNGSGGSCDESTTHTVEWKLSGSYTDLVSVATTWVTASGQMSTPGDPKYSHTSPATGTLLTESLPGCTGAGINITTLDGGSDNVVIFSDLTLGIYVDGALADSVTLNGSYSAGTTLPSIDGLVVVVGE